MNGEDAASQRNRRLMAFFVAALSLAVFQAYSVYTGVALEDAFITYRYARNIAVGNGFVFNAGEHVLGTTSPLLALLLGGVGRLFGAEVIPEAAALLMLALGVAAAVLMNHVLFRITGSVVASLVGAVLFAVNPTILLTACGGMETPLVLTLMLGGLALALSGRWIASGLFLALLIMTRIDGCIWAAVVALYALGESRRGALRLAVAAAVCLVPYVALTTWYFGSPVPHSVVAKRVIGPDWLFGPLASVARLKKYGRFLASTTGCGPASFPGVAVILGVIGVAARKENRRSACIFLVFPACYLAALYLGRAPTNFEWYVAPVIVCTSALAGIGARELLSALRRYRFASAAALVAFVCAMGVFAALDARREFRRSKVWQCGLESGLRQPVGEWIHDNTREDASVAMEAIGYQGYYSERRVIDIAGLVSPDVVRIRRTSASNAEAFGRILRELHPDYVVLRTFEVGRNLHFHGGPLFANDKDRAFFFSCYKPARRFVAPIVYGSLSDITIYGKTELIFGPPLRTTVPMVW